jgi:import inner membrane translocase subunit TIM50
VLLEHRSPSIQFLNKPFRSRLRIQLCVHGGIKELRVKFRYSLSTLKRKKGRSGGFGEFGEDVFASQPSCIHVSVHKYFWRELREAREDLEQARCHSIQRNFLIEATRCCVSTSFNMLSRATVRSLQTHVLRAPPASFRIASSTVWTRSMARNNRPGHGHKNPTDYSRPPGAPQPPRPGGAGAAFTSPQPGARSSDKSGRPDYSKSQDELSEAASPERNTVPRPGGQGAANHNSHKTGEESGEAQDFSTKQDEFQTTASPSAIDPGDAQAQSRPLPDLTQGIPSTLQFETTGATKSAVSPLNLTEAEEPGQAPGGGRGRGELPASAYISSSERKRLKFANYMYALFAGLSVTGTIYLGRNWESEEEEKAHPNAPSGWALGLMWNRARARLGDQLNYYNEPAFRKLLPDPDPIFERPYTLIVSLEDLLIHSEWSREHGWRMAKRPGVDYFLRYLSQYYELVIFTSQPWAIAEPVIRKLDPYHIVTWPLFREATFYENGEYVKVS